MIRRPPRSTRTDTLFPYTTLFLSRERADCDVVRRGRFCGSMRASVGPTRLAFPDSHCFLEARARRPRGPASLAPQRGRQRKSPADVRSEEHTSELQSLMRISYAVFCLKTKIHKHDKTTTHHL